MIATVQITILVSDAAQRPGSHLWWLRPRPVRTQRIMFSSQRPSLEIEHDAPPGPRRAPGGAVAFNPCALGQGVIHPGDVVAWRVGPMEATE